MSHETSDESWPQSARAQQPETTARPASVDQDSLAEAERRVKARLKLRMAQAVAAVLGVLILLVVGLMVYLAFSKYTDRQRKQAEELGTPVQASQDPLATRTSVAVPGFVPAGCELVQHALDGGRLVLIFAGVSITGGSSECRRLVILNSNTGAVVLDRPLFDTIAEK